MDDIKVKKFDRMEQVHHLLSGAKAVFTEEAIETIDVCRRASGGAGYQSHSGFSDLASDFSPNPTWEGDNTVMLLQSVKLVLKLHAASLQDPKKVHPFPFTYVSDLEKLLSIKGRVKTLDHILDLQVIE